ncbi:DNA ligase [Streptomyces sp. NPDC048219]|uniref:ATP-dependent DNA ligase n=1 Tax=Streptomyces sp. NPDC048219 TaxID=3365517 RepID=UPI00371D6375
MDFPVQVAEAGMASELPAGAGWAFEWKFDGDRAVLWRGTSGVRLQSRSGRDVTAAWPDLAAAGMALRPGTVLDGECVIWRGGRVDFGAVRSRASSSPARAAELAERLPASLPVWDVLMHPELGDVRGRPWRERRALLVDLVAELDGPPIQAVPVTEDASTAREWITALQPRGIEGVVCKRVGSPYRPGRIWVKVRASVPADAVIVGYAGPVTRPRTVALRLPSGAVRFSRPLTAALSAEVAAHVRRTGGARGRRVLDGVPYSGCAELAAEVEAGATRHPTVTVRRVRPDLL